MYNAKTPKKYNGLEVTILKMGWEGGVSHPESMNRHYTH